MVSPTRASRSCESRLQKEKVGGEGVQAAHLRSALVSSRLPFLVTCAAKDVRESVVPLMTRVLVEHVLELSEVHLAAPQLGVRGGIVDRELVVDDSLVDAVKRSITFNSSVG